MSGHDPTPPPSGERRAHPRVACSVVFPFLHPPGHDDDASGITAINLSASGLRFRSARPFRAGDHAVIRMTGHRGGTGLVGLDIMHADPATGHYGARFVAPRPAVVRRALDPREGRPRRASA